MATTGKGGLVTIAVYPTTRNASAIIKLFARPNFVDIVLMKNAAVMKPMAVHTKISDTVPYPMV
jgi:hypothetical protein